MFNINIPDGYFIGDNFVLWGEVNSLGNISCVYECIIPDISNASEGTKVFYEKKLTNLLSSMSSLEQRMQFFWDCNGDYGEKLNYYASKEIQESWTKRTRDDVLTFFQGKNKDKKLRKERLFISFSIKLSLFKNSPKWKLVLNRYKVDYSYKELLELIKSYFEDFHNKLTSLFSDCVIHRLSNQKIGKLLFYFFNPSLRGIRDLKINENKSVAEQCYQSPFRSRKKEDLGYSAYYDGFYHNFIVLRDLPSINYMTAIKNITLACTNNISITVNFSYINTEKKKKFLDKEIIKRRNTEQASVAVGTEKLIEAVEEIESGVKAVRVEFIVHLYDEREEELSQRTSLLKRALHSYEDLVYYEGVWSSEVLTFFIGSIPTNPFNDYKYHTIETDTRFIPSMIPFSATPIGSGKAEALYEGNQDNIVGISSFLGGQPQHAICLGGTGSGKSSFLIDYLSQTSSYYDYRVIIDEGKSYAALSLVYGIKPIIIRENSDISINYFDTRKQPLSSFHISLAISLISMMAGKEGEQDYEGIIQQLVQKTYDEKLSDFLQKNRSKEVEGGRRIVAVYEYSQKEKQKASLDKSYIDYWNDYSFLLKGDKREEILLYERSISIDKINKFKLEESDIFRNAMFAFFDSKDFPIHQDLINMIGLSLSASKYAKEKIQHLHSTLSVFGLGGSYGKILNGITNVDITSKFVYFELGEIPESKKKLKELVTVLLINDVRNYILSMSKKQRKEILIEEATRFITIKNGENIINELYEQFRKQHCRVISVTQTFGRFPEQTRKVLASNVRQIFIGRVPKDDTDLLSQNFSLSKEEQKLINDFPYPNEIKNEKPYSSILYWQSGKISQTAILKIRMTDLMGKIAFASGEDLNDYENYFNKYEEPIEALEHMLLDEKELAGNV